MGSSASQPARSGPPRLPAAEPTSQPRRSLEPGACSAEATPADPATPPLLADLTDAAFERYWKAGALKYRNFRPLAEGGTARLELCLDTNLGREVVFKSLHPHLADARWCSNPCIRIWRITRVSSSAFFARPG